MASFAQNDAVLLGKDLVTQNLNGRHMRNRAKLEVGNYCEHTNKQTNVASKLDSLMIRCEIDAFQQLMRAFLGDVVISLRTNVTMFTDTIKFKNDGIDVTISTKNRNLDMKKIMQQQLISMCSIGDYAFDGKNMKEIVDYNWDKPFLTLPYLDFNSLPIHNKTCTQKNDNESNFLAHILALFMLAMNIRRIYMIF
jgi:hypothetical protein